MKRSGAKNIQPIMISACLIGINCRYDGILSPWNSFLEWLSLNKEHMHFIPFCPEQLGGLPTPRSPSFLISGDGNHVLQGMATVEDGSGKDMTASFIKGAEQAFNIASIVGCTTAIMKDKSPSCGLSTVRCKTEAYSFAGSGVTAAMLLSKGIKIIETGKDSLFNPDILRQ